MKIILSRKGFDSSAGGHANPIYPDGRMFSLPIPSSLDTINYDDLLAPMGKSVKHVIDELDDGARILGKGAHADPELIRGQRPRNKGWCHSLGQISQASGHLRNQNIGAGDLFLFYGWFRHTKFENGRLRFRKDLPGYHAIYGYLEIDEVVAANKRSDLPAWLLDHPHAVDARLAKPTNSIYVARKYSEKLKDYAGAGVFRFRDALVLTKPGLTRSRWRLDTEIFRHLEITYHTDAAWRDDYFQSYPRAQEYVVHADSRAVDWAYELIRDSETWDL